ncbi:testis- and ovary-specific PAZ domain-containing protein 1, partial [Striga asiatica]
MKVRVFCERPSKVPNLLIILLSLNMIDGVLVELNSSYVLKSSIIFSTYRNLRSTHEVVMRNHRAIKLEKRNSQILPICAQVMKCLIIPATCVTIGSCYIILTSEQVNK